MPADPGFKDFVLDQLAPLGDVWARAMFGGYGLYADGLFFGLIAGDRLYFKTDAETRPVYEERGMSPFRPSATQTMNYHEAPPDLLDDQERLVAWARQAVEVARVAASNQRSTRRRGRTSRRNPVEHG